MIATPEEAKTKPCPLSPVNRFDYCQASGCMAWRWHDRATKTVVTVVDADYEPLTHEVENTKRRGYCGLAGEVKYA